MIKLPIKTYFNSLLDKPFILQDNKNKSGIYRWVNLVNGKSYVGCSMNLYNRFKFYLLESNLKTATKKGHSAIYSALLEHGFSNFKLEILEYSDCNRSELLKKETYYIILYNSEYNLLKIKKPILITKLTK